MTEIRMRGDGYYSTHCSSQGLVIDRALPLILRRSMHSIPRRPAHCSPSLISVLPTAARQSVCSARC